MYCVYLTIYKGNKLPPFYIGSSSVNKVNKGYHGTVSSKLYKDVWEKELKINKSLFNTLIVSIHNTRSEAYEKENKIQIQLNVVENNLYINQAITTKTGFGRLNQLGKNNPMYGKSRKMSEETKKKMSKTHTGLKESEETRRKKSKALSGKIRSETHKNNLSISIRGKNHPNYGKTRESSIHFGKIWINNGVVNFYGHIDVIPNGWRKGMLPKKKRSVNTEFYKYSQ